MKKVKPDTLARKLSDGVRISPTQPCGVTFDTSVVDDRQETSIATQQTGRLAAERNGRSRQAGARQTYPEQREALRALRRTSASRPRGTGRRQVPEPVRCLVVPLELCPPPPSVSPACSGRVFNSTMRRHGWQSDPPVSKSSTTNAFLFRHGDDGGSTATVSRCTGSIHPLVAGNRDADGVLQVWPATASGTHESFFHVGSPRSRTVPARRAAADVTRLARRRAFRR